jgi:hypothetical protein
MEARAVSTDAKLRVALERIAQAAEQYLDTEHRDGARDLDLRRNLSEAATDAALVLYPSDAHPE